MTDLTKAVADAIFMVADVDTNPGRQDCEAMATVALDAVRVQGWRIVKTGKLNTPGVIGGVDIVMSEWKP